MRRFSNILAFVDVAKGKSLALSRAIQLARSNGAQLTVVDVVRELPRFVNAMIGDTVAAHEQQHADRLRALTSWMRGEPIRATIKVLHGRPAFALVREVLSGQHDLLIKDAHIEEETGLLFGGMDLRLLRNCPCCVWLVKPGHHGSFERVLAAIDPQPSFEGESLNVKIMELASSMSVGEESDLSVVSVWRAFPDATYELGDWQPGAAYPKGFVEDAARQVLDAVLKKSEAEVPTDRVHFGSGRAGPAISRVARQIEADLLVMGTVARTGIPGFLIGNTAERVLRDVNCSVLTVKPDDFVSPIRPEEDEQPRDALPLAPA